MQESQMDGIDTAKLEIDDRYSSADSIFESLVQYIMEALREDNQFTKQIYRYLINDGTVKGWQLCVALYDQGVLEYDAEEVARLSAGGDSYAYTFIRSKIKSIELTPAQLALDPCTGLLRDCRRKYRRSSGTGNLSRL